VKRLSGVYMNRDILSRHPVTLSPPTRERVGARV
jgi:hypothetical protein